MLRMVSTLLVGLIFLVKLGVIQSDINESIIHYLFNGFILLFVVLNVTPFISLLQVRAYKGEYQDEFTVLLSKTDIPKSIEVYLAQSFFSKNAATFYGWNNPIILIGQDIYKACTDQEIMFLLYHEYYHIKQKHVVINYLSFITCVVIIPIVILIVSPYLLKVSIIGTLFLIFWIYISGLLIHFYFSRQRELRADIFAAKEIGKDIGISLMGALSKKQTMNRMLGIFSTHPTMKTRIQNIKSMN